ncbi:MAG: hypothetical protein QOI31_815 [Solirubrobacterales bacterium]|jgi:hypothetical protein|nr:hypothetical protein [Solirubrobacterales bacterium]
MGSGFVRHLRSNVVAYIALFFALGVGTAWALDANSIKSKHIKDGQVKSVDVRDDDVTGADIDESTLDGLDADTLDGTRSCSGQILVESSEVICQLGDLKVIGTCGGNLSGTIDFETGLDANVILGARGDTVITDSDVDPGETITMITETDPEQGVPYDTSPPLTFYAYGPSGVMAGTAGLTALNQGPGLGFCFVTYAITMTPGA